MSASSDSGLQMELNPPAPPPVVRGPAVRPPLVKQKSVAASVPAPSPAKAPVVAKEETAPASDESPVAPAWYSIRSTPSWLVSLAAHLILLILLALFTVTTQPKLLATIIDGAFAEESTDIEQVVEMTLDPIENIEHMASSPIGSELAAVDVTEVGGEAAAVTVGAGDLVVDSVSDVGGLFDGDAPGMKESGMAALKGAEFFGVKASGRKFVFVVDSSNSMRNGKFAAAKEELEYAIRRLSSEQLFYVVFFDQDAERMVLAPETEPETNVVAATSTNINRFVTWMKTVKNESRTDPYEAVKFALSLKPDAIFILSDGKFTDRGKTVRFLEDENVIDDPETGKRPRAIVHTIAFWQRDGEEAMQAIAKTHKGTYRFVPQPRK
jgi:hypothetical protein